MDYTQEIIRLSKIERALSFKIAQVGYESHHGILRLKSRAVVREHIEKLAEKVRPQLPTYVSNPVPRILTPPGTVDLIDDHNKRFILARLAVLQMKMERWNKK